MTDAPVLLKRPRGRPRKDAPVWVPPPKVEKPPKPGPPSDAFLVNGQVFFQPHPGRQAALLQVLQARVLGRGDAPANVFVYGNRGSGKSVLVRKFLHALAMAIPGFKYACVRRNLPDLHKNHLIYLGKEMRTLGGSFHQTLHQANYPNTSLGFYSQCETEQDVEKIVGAEVAVLYVDEAPQIKWDYLRMLGPSLRVPKGLDGTVPYRTLAIYGGNPIGESIEELFQYFVDKTVELEADPEYRPEDFLAFELRREDNPSLDEDEYRKQFAGLPAHYRKAWLDGVRMDARSMFDVFPRKDGRPYHVIEELPSVQGVPLREVPWVQWYRAFDMGYFPDPALCLWIAVVGRRVIVVQERQWFRTIAKDLAVEILRDTGEVTMNPVTMTYIDPVIAMKTGSDTVTVMDTLEMSGVPCEPSINDRVLYADAIHGLLGEEVEPGVPRLQIYGPGCPMLTKYLPKMRWDETNPRKLANHKMDHAVVALAYFAISSGVLTMSAEQTTATEPVWMSWVRESRGRQRRTH